MSQNNASSNIYALKPGHTVAMVTNGDEVISIEITGTISSASTLTGTVLLTGTSGTARTMTVQVTDTLGSAGGSFCRKGAKRLETERKICYNVGHRDIPVLFVF